MAPLTDPHLLAAIRQAFVENRRFVGYVTWKPRAQEWVRREFANHTARAIADIINDYITSGGTIDQIRETREEWLEYSYHYDVRLEIMERRIYVEMLLLREEPADPHVEIVSIHDV